MTADSRQVLVIDTGVANIASMLAALERIGLKPVLSRDASAVLDSARLVLPGVGRFGAAMQTLSRHKLVEPLVTRMKQGEPTLCVCVGMQVLFEKSEESPEQAGMGLVPGEIKRFGPQVQVPQFGWNLVKAQPKCGIIKDGYAYFANSYRVVTPPADWAWAGSEHGGRFVSAIEKGALLACQFHPELSGAWGMGLLERWRKRGDQPYAAVNGAGGAC